MKTSKTDSRGGNTMISRLFQRITARFGAKNRQPTSAQRAEFARIITDQMMETMHGCGM